MAVRKYLLGLVAILGLGFVAEVKGQHYLPFADPLAFDPDFRFFEPMYQADFEDMRPRNRASHGWYGGYSKAHIWFSQPKGPLDVGGDWGWGERIDLGYMLEEDSGWSMSFIDTAGPSAYASAGEYQQFNQFFNDGAFEPISPLENDIIVPDYNRNDLFELERVHNLLFSRNVLEFSSAELNKTWRMDPHAHGGILEPLVGIRYINADDMGYASYYDRTFLPQVIPLPFANQVFDSLTEHIQTTSNYLYGGQFGFRYYKYRNRWTFGTDVRMMAMHNHYVVRQTVTIDETSYDDPVAINDRAVDHAYAAQTVEFDRTVFSFGLDVRAEASYQLTKAFSLRAGVQVFEIFRGIARTPAIPAVSIGPTPAFSMPDVIEQDLGMVLVTFGGTINL